MDLPACAHWQRELAAAAARVQRPPPPTPTSASGVSSCGLLIQRAVQGALLAQHDVPNPEVLRDALAAASVALVAAWDVVHSGEWRSVSLEARQAYAVAAELTALCLGAQGRFPLALRTVDIALILVLPDDRPPLQLLAAQLQLHISPVTSRTELPGTWSAAEAVAGDIGPQRGATSDHPLPRLDLPPLDVFLNQHIVPRRPVILTGCMSAWPAMARWRNPAYLLGVAGDRTVPVEVGANYMADGWRTTLTTLRQFIEGVLVRQSEGGPRSASTPDDTCSDRVPTDAGAARLREGDEASPSYTAVDAMAPVAPDVAYLAQHALFEQVPQLRADIIVPDYCALLPPIATPRLLPSVEGADMAPRDAFNEIDDDHSEAKSLNIDVQIDASAPLSHLVKRSITDDTVQPLHDPPPAKKLRPAGVSTAVFTESSQTSRSPRQGGSVRADECPGIISRGGENGSYDSSTHNNTTAAACGYDSSSGTIISAAQPKGVAIPPPPTAVDDDDEVSINAYFGPAGTVSCLHYDDPHNLLCQVFGQKRIRLYAPSLSPDLYPREGTMCNTSAADPAAAHTAPHIEAFPRFPSSPSFDCVLGPGEMLYIPPKYWHHVTALDPSFSVSFWWGRGR